MPRRRATARGRSARGARGTGARRPGPGARGPGGALAALVAEAEAARAAWSSRAGTGARLRASSRRAGGEARGRSRRPGPAREEVEAVASACARALEAQRAERAPRERAHVDGPRQPSRAAPRPWSRAAPEASLRDTDHALREIKEALAHPGHFPSRRERDELLARLESARRQLYPLLQQLREDVEWKRFANVSVQEELAARAEALVAEPNLERAAACSTSSTGAGSWRRRPPRTRARRSGRASRRRATR